eukprot:TRINITY_DN1532_c0_g1_i1.p1 TRINITY_DN1532_c0_g1~~TRINITY_DN1532_c0_g1_i1.p1  ORF type:complete len:131 (-),score=39.81 TRINITY_DN1532_c0_g1_i1:107-442(-)
MGQYLDALYCALLYPDAANRNIAKYTMPIDDDDHGMASDYLFGEYFTYWNPDHPQFCRCKYPDLKTELMNNRLYSIKQRDFFCLYNRAKDFLLSIMARLQTAKRVKMANKN